LEFERGGQRLDVADRYELRRGIAFHTKSA
jgi:hypothetical protein